MTVAISKEHYDDECHQNAISNEDEPNIKYSDELFAKVKESQIHEHRDSCRKKGGFCRYNFPRLPSRKTLIAKPLPDDMPEGERKDKLDKATFILKLAKAKLEELDKIKSSDSIKLNEFLRSLSNEFEKEYHKELDIDDYEEALSISEKGQIIILKRNVNERNVNNYNPFFLNAWEANCDLQFCLCQSVLPTSTFVPIFNNIQFRLCQFQL